MTRLEIELVSCCAAISKAGVKLRCFIAPVDVFLFGGPSLRMDRINNGTTARSDGMEAQCSAPVAAFPQKTAVIFTRFRYMLFRPSI
jgi:hypothetical protein